MSRWDSAAMVSKTRELLPEPDTPVKTVSRRLGISTEMSLRLFSRAPWTRIVSWLSAGCTSFALVSRFSVMTTPRSLGGEPDHRVLPVGFALVLGDAGLGRGDLSPSLFPLGSSQLVRRHRLRVTAMELDGYRIRLSDEVPVPVGMAISATRADHQP